MFLYSSILKTINISLYPSITTDNYNDLQMTITLIAGCVDGGRQEVCRPDGDQTVRDVSQGQYQRGGDVQGSHRAGAQVQKGKRMFVDFL